ncbi:MAG: hypothetical protein Q9226_005350, partial [Calogaya cf. arnoldii]
TVITREYDFPTYKQFAHIEHFRARQSFELNFNLNGHWWRHHFGEQLHEDEPIWWKQPKEWLRTVLTSPGLLAQTEVIIFDLLKPLRQLQVEKPVQFVRPGVSGLDLESTCESCAQANEFANTEFIEDLVKSLCKGLGRLDGERLSGREETWKKFKAMPRVPELGGRMTLQAENILDRVHHELSRKFSPFKDLDEFDAANDTGSDYSGIEPDWTEWYFERIAAVREKDLWKQWDEHMRPNDLKNKMKLRSGFTNEDC